MSDELRNTIIAALKTVHDPEIPVNIHDLGLIYGLDIDPSGAGGGSAGAAVRIRMTLTSPNCPVADKIPAEVQQKVKAVPGVSDAKVELTFDPPWSREMMSERAQVELEMMGIHGPAHLQKPRFTDVTIRKKTRDA